MPDDKKRFPHTRDIPPGIETVRLVDEPLAQMAARVTCADKMAILLRYTLLIRNRRFMRAWEAPPEHKSWAEQRRLK